jgi:hypothetical protein
MYVRLNLFLEYKFLNAYGAEKYFKKILWRQHETHGQHILLSLCFSDNSSNNLLKMHSYDMSFRNSGILVAIVTNAHKVLLHLYFMTFNILLTSTERKYMFFNAKCSLIVHADALTSVQTFLYLLSLFLSVQICFWSDLSNPYSNCHVLFYVFCTCIVI